MPFGFATNEPTGLSSLGMAGAAPANTCCTDKPAKLEGRLDTRAAKIGRGPALMEDMVALIH